MTKKEFIEKLGDIKDEDEIDSFFPVQKPDITAETPLTITAAEIMKLLSATTIADDKTKIKKEEPLNVYF